MRLNGDAGGLRILQEGWRKNGGQDDLHGRFLLVYSRLHLLKVCGHEKSHREAAGAVDVLCHDNTSVGKHAMQSVGDQLKTVIVGPAFESFSAGWIDSPGIGNVKA